MKTANIRAVALSLLVCLSVGIGKAQAQSNTAIRRFKEGVTLRITDYMKSYYSLSDAQAQTVAAINAIFIKNAKPVILSDEEKMTKLLKIKKLVSERETSLRKVFTPEQTRQFEAKKKERKVLLSAWLEDS